MTDYRWQVYAVGALILPTYGYSAEVCSNAYSSRSKDHSMTNLVTGTLCFCTSIQRSSPGAGQYRVDPGHLVLRRIFSTLLHWYIPLVRHN